MGCTSTRDHEYDGKGSGSAIDLIRDKLQFDIWAPQGTNEANVTEILPGYRVKEVIKQTSRFKLVRAEYMRTKQSCFVKIIPKGPASDPLQTTFLTEAQHLLSMDHPNILKTYEATQDTVNFYVVSEPFYCSLQDCIRDSRFQDETFLAKSLQQVLRALCYCHKRGIVHGRLSPHCIVLRDAPANDSVRLKLTGFGLLDELDNSTCNPFECKDKELSEKSDIWSCGLLTYHCLGGQVPPERLFSEPQWVDRSDGAIFFVNSLLGAYTRPSAQDCLCSPWLKQRVTPTASDSQFLEKFTRILKRKSCKSALKEAVLRFVVERVIKPKDTDYLVEPFHALDLDNDGVINASELIERLKNSMTKIEAIAAVRRTTSCHNDNDLTFSRFVMMLMGNKRLLTMRTLRIVFHCITPDPQGRATLSEIRRVLGCGYLDHLQGGGLNFSEFSRLLRPSLIE